MLFTNEFQAIHDSNPPNNDIRQMTLFFPCAILVAVKPGFLEHMMRYEGSPQYNEKPKIERILAVVNSILVIVIAFCLDYMLVKLLFR